MSGHTHLRVRFCTHCRSFLMALLCSRMAVDADCLSSDGVLQKDVSESELVRMDDRLEEEGNWLLMFPVNSLIWKIVGSYFPLPLSEYHMPKFYGDTAQNLLFWLLSSKCTSNCGQKLSLLYNLVFWKDYKQVKGQVSYKIYYIMDTMTTMAHDVNILTVHQ